MKCVCGYEYEEPERDIDENIVISQIGDEPFLECENMVFISPTFGKFEERTGVFTSIVYACPKCGTIKIEPEK